jgi:hypothetical protein
MSEQYLFNPEDLEYLSKLLSRTYMQTIQSSTSEEGEVIVESIQLPPVIDVEIVRQIDLDVIASYTAGIYDPLGQLRDFIVAIYNSVSSWVVSSVTAFISTYVTPTLKNIASFLSNTVLPAISGVVVSVSVSVKGFIDTYILPAISGAQSLIIGAISSVSIYISTHIVPTLQSIMTGLGNVSSIVVSSVSGFIQTYVIPAIVGLRDIIVSAVGGIGNFISTYVIPAFNWLYISISGFIAQYIVTPLSGFYGFIVESYIKISALVSYGFDTISRTFMGFVNAVLQLPTLLWNTIPKWITEGWIAISSFAMSIAEFFKEPVKWLKWLAESVWGLLKWLGDIVLGGLKFLSEKLWEGAVGFWNMVKGGLEAVSKSIVDFTMNLVGVLTNSIIEGAKIIGKRMLDAVHGFMDWAINSAKEISEDLGKLIAETMTMTITPIIGGVTSGFGEPLIKTFETSSKGSVGGIELTERRLREISKEISEVNKLIALYLREYSLAILYSQTASYGVWMALHGIATPLDKIEIKTPFKIKVKVSGHGRPAGVGGEVGTEKEGWVEYPIEIKPGLLLRQLASEIRDSANTFIRSMMYGVGIWFTRPIMRLAYAMLRNTFPVELPTINELIEITRRHMPTDAFDEMLDECRSILKLYGFNDQTIEWITKTVEESIEEKRMIITVKDRFDNDRNIPLSLIYQLPSASDIARMSIRDIFGMGATAIDSFIQVYSARGMHRDIGILYYLLHYKYPPPERLWTFVARGWSGMLWATIPKELMDSIQKEAEKLGAPIPTNARDWNFKAKGLWSALQMYMTWHDYARFTWIPKKYIGEANFTSDNQIILDTLADIPTKIDMRWMVRWGLYDFLASKGVSLKSEVRDFAVKILEDSASSNITMDLSNFARTLQATGLHPDWVPIIAVAETMNAFTEERTMLRTGFLGLFKEGFYDVKSLETMLSGFIKVSFKVAYFDSVKMEWVTDKYVNIPVMHLPPERRLIELRALMDRALDILRVIQRDISNAYVDSIVLNYEEYKSKLSSVIDKVNEVYASDFENITGIKLPDELKLKFVEGYYKPYVEGLAIFREVYTVRRIRSWTMRWLGWIMYRVATGLVTSEELTKLVDILVKYAKLTDTERQFFKDVFDAMSGITVREYAPTPQQIASLSEYIVIPEDLIKKVFEVKMIGKDWQPIWQQYITVRPVVDDIKALIGTYRRVSLYVKVPEDIEKQVKEYAKLINYTDREWAILGLRNQLEEQLIEYRESKREYIPTLSMLASISEVIPSARKFFNAVVKARKIPEDWQPLWQQYVTVKPLIDDVKKYVSRAEELYARFMTDEDAYKTVLNTVADIVGYESKEIEFMLQTARMERTRYAWSELIGDVDRMTMLAEYSPDARSFALATLNKMIDALPVSQEVKDMLKKMWEQFIRIKPVKDEVTSYVRDLINALVDGNISWDTFSSELDALREWGLDDYEIQFYKAIATLRKARKLKITIG